MCFGEEWRRVTHTERTHTAHLDYIKPSGWNLSFLVLASPVMWFPTYSKGRGKIWPENKGGKCFRNITAKGDKFILHVKYLLLGEYFCQSLETELCCSFCQHTGQPEWWSSRKDRGGTECESVTGKKKYTPEQLTWPIPRHRKEGNL